MVSAVQKLICKHKQAGKNRESKHRKAMRKKASRDEGLEAELSTGKAIRVCLLIKKFLKKKKGYIIRVLFLNFTKLALLFLVSPNVQV